MNNNVLAGGVSNTFRGYVLVWFEKTKWFGEEASIFTSVFLTLGYD